MRFVTLLLFTLAIQYVAYSQDKIITKLGNNIVCKVTKEDSLNCYFNFSKNGIKTNTFIRKEEISEIVFDEERFKKDSIGFSMYGKRTKMLGLSGSLTKDKYNTVSIMATSSYNYFVLKGVFIGGSLAYSYESMGLAKKSMYGIGPNIGVVLIAGKVNPYVYGSAMIDFYQNTIKSYQDPLNSSAIISSSTTNITGSDLSCGLGLLIPLNKSVNLVIESQLHFLAADDKMIESQRVMAIAFGLNAVFH